MIAPVIDVLGPALQAVAGELVIVDGTPDASGVNPDAVAAPSRRVRVVRVRVPDVFELRAVGLAEASGEIVAITEDHCIPSPDFVSMILRAHAEHSQALVAGAVVNGSTERAIDRANFLAVHARNLPPRSSKPPAGWIPSPSNVSYKRAALPRSKPARGWIETVLNVRMLFEGKVALDDRVLVRHIQCRGILATFGNHFHAGRSMGGLGREAVGPRSDQLRWGFRMAPLIPFALTRPAWERRSLADSREVMKVSALVFALGCADAIGFLAGVLAGPGQSPKLVR
jgi:hypothetical protein